MAARLTAYLVAVIVGLTVIAGLLAGAQRDYDGPVDLIVVNGRVYTADEDGTMAEAVAIQGNRILMVGSNRDVERLRRPQTVVVDAQGGSVLPGFIDTHAHLIEAGLRLEEAQLEGARTLAEVEAAISAWMKANPDENWVLGRGWSRDAFAGHVPARELLDALVPDRPALITADDGRRAWANSAALAAAKITRRTPAPPGGVIVRDPRTGEPTGELEDAALDLVRAQIPAPTSDELRAAAEAAIAEAHRHGVTSVHVPEATGEMLALFDELRRTSGLHLRIYAALEGDIDASADAIAMVDALGERYLDDPLLKTGAIAFDVTADPARLASLERAASEIDARGWQLILRTSDPRALEIALDVVERTSRARTGDRERRHRIEHAGQVPRALVARAAELGVILSMPLPAFPAADVAARVPPPETTEGAPPTAVLYRAIVDAGGRFVLGSDWPYLPLDPLRGLHAALDAPDGLAPLQLPEAIAAYTRDAAWASFDEHRKGVLARDMLADLVILTEDVFALPASRLAQAEVACTIFDGRVMYRRDIARTN